MLIKLNLLSSKPPEAAVTTHPAIVKAVDCQSSSYTSTGSRGYSARG